MQWPRGRDARVLLAQRAGGGVARVDEEPLSRVGLALVHGVEVGDGHVDLAAHLEHVGVRAPGVGQLCGHVLDGGDVGGDVLARHAVAPCGGLHETTLLIHERHGDAVDLGLAREGQRVEVERRVGPAQAVAPGAQLVLVERVVEAHHRDAVAHLLEETRGRGTHRLGRRVRRHQGGIVRLELAQLKDEDVVLRVGDRGRVEHVVELVVVPDQRAQLLDARHRLGRDVPAAVPAGAVLARAPTVALPRHGQAAMPAPTTASGSATS